MQPLQDPPQVDECDLQNGQTLNENNEPQEQRKEEIDQAENVVAMKDYLNELDLEFYGVNKKLYKKPDKNGKNQEDIAFKTITDYVFLPCSPEFDNLPEVLEPVNIPRQNVLQESLRKEVESILFADSHINRMVYDCKDPSPFTENIEPSSLGLDILPYYIPQSRDDALLVFESRFESGNLKRVIQISDYEYDLILSTDYQTTAHTQWYYFSVANTRKNVEYRFKIVNMMKADSLYNVGMKPLVYSDRKAKLQSKSLKIFVEVGWHRSGSDICYYTTNLKRKNGGYYNALCFTLKFQHDNDCVYIAHCYPYTYTHLQRYLRSLENDPVKRNKFTRKTLCLTESGNNCDYLTIGETPNTAKQKKVIFLTSRVHPGQTMVSHLIEYIIDYLLSNHPTARLLRDNFIFRIIPMLNVDGVINGNYRCNLFGADLNRQWVDPSRKTHPTIYYAKNVTQRVIQLIKKSKEERELLIYCDFHGHSRKKNIFMYGCSGKDPVRRQQIFPMLMKNNCPVFSFKDCCFTVQKDREGAARIALWKQLNIVNCFTLELSFCGPDFGKYEYFHFNLSTFKEIAHSFCQSIYDHYQPDQVKYKQALEQVEVVLKTVKYDDKKGDETDSDYSDEDVKQAPQNAANNANGLQLKTTDQKRSLEGRQHNSLPQSDGNKVIIKKKLPLALPAKKKK